MSNLNRSDWEFEYSAKQLWVAATMQRDYRETRVKAWEAKKEEIVAKIKSSGLTVHEGPSNDMKGYTNSVGGAHVMVDTTLQRDLNECVDKISTHRKAMGEYEGWVQMLAAQPTEIRLKLKHADWMFFFGK